MKVLLLTVMMFFLILGGCSIDRISGLKNDNITVGPSICDEEHPDRTVGLRLCKNGISIGYTLFSPLLAKKTYLIDHLGRKVHQWNLQRPASIVNLLNNGMLLITGRPAKNVSRLDNGGIGGMAGIIQILDWDSKVVWEYLYVNDEQRAHHDVHMMPNGNILIIAWEYKDRDVAIAMGRNPELVKNALWPDKIIEIKPVKDKVEILWEWHAWDHLVQNVDPMKPNFGRPEEHPELININFANKSDPSWLHINGIDYNEKLDQIVLSVLNFSEIWVIDHSTTRAEAASHSGGKWGKGGDLLFRWGNPQAYGAGSANDQIFFAQHNAQWIDAGLPGAGHFLVFNNGRNRNGDNKFSTVDELIPEFGSAGEYLMKNGRFAPERIFWTYKADKGQDFYSDKFSGAQRLPNGNTLICSGVNGLFFEVTPDGRKVWEYINPVEANSILAQGEHSEVYKPASVNSLKTAVFRAYRIPPEHPGLKDRDLIPQGVIERPEH